MRNRISILGHPPDITRISWVVLGVTFGLAFATSLLTSRISWADGDQQCNDICNKYMYNPDGTYSFNTWSDTDRMLCKELGVNTQGSDGMTPPPTSVPSTVPEIGSDGVTPTGGTLCTLPTGVIPALYKFKNGTGSGTMSNSDNCDWAKNMQMNCQAHLNNSPLIAACQAYFAILGTTTDTSKSGQTGKNEQCMQNQTGVYGSIVDSGNGGAASQGAGTGTAPVPTPGQDCSKLNMPTMDPIKTEETLIGLDATASLLCGIACVAPNVGTLPACSAAAIASTAVEVAATIVLSAPNTGIANYVQDGMTGLGGAMTIGVTGMAGRSFKNSVRAANEEYNKTACATSIVMAALTGIRAFNIVELNKSATNACNAVKSLASGGAQPSPNPSPFYTGLSDGGGGAAPGSGGGGNGGGAAQGGGTSTQASSSSPNPVDQCMAQSTSSGTNPTAAGTFCANNTGFSAQSATAGSDGKLLNGLGTGTLLGKLPDTLSNIAKKASTQGAGAALSSMMPASLGEFGGALSNIAQAAQDDGARLSGALTNSTYSSGGAASRGGGGGAAGNDPSGLASIFGGATGMGGSTMHGPGLASFGVVATQIDIWHAGIKTSLFDIVSDKIMRVSNRVK